MIIIYYSVHMYIYIYICAVCITAMQITTICIYIYIYIHKIITCVLLHKWNNLQIWAAGLHCSRFHERGLGNDLALTLCLHSQHTRCSGALEEHIAVETKLWNHDDGYSIVILVIIYIYDYSVIIIIILMVVHDHDPWVWWAQSMHSLYSVFFPWLIDKCCPRICFFCNMLSGTIWEPWDQRIYRLEWTILLSS